MEDPILNAQQVMDVLKDTSCETAGIALKIATELLYHRRIQEANASSSQLADQT
jgi:hypothetical protein